MKKLSITKLANTITEKRKVFLNKLITKGMILWHLQVVKF